MPKIICPYCCKRFEPSKMTFRLERALDSDSGSADYLGDLDEGVKDEKLIRYYMDKEKDDEATATQNARKLNRYGCIDIDILAMEADISNYDGRFLNQYGFVMELDYKNQHLTQRVCPYCHNHLFRTAGLNEMKMIAMYGDTSAGKTVYLYILEAMLQGRPELGKVGYAFEGQMFFVGSLSAKAEHDSALNRILQKKSMPDATTLKGRVPAPQIFEYTYKTAKVPGWENTEKTINVIFRDIPGEACTQGELEKFYFLKEADGLIILLDSSKLNAALPFLNPDQYANVRAMDSLNNLKLLLSEIYGNGRIKKPAAVVLSKGDLMKEVPTISEKFSKEYQAVMEVPNANEIHQKYLDRKAIKELNDNLYRILDGIDEKWLLGTIDKCFEDYSLFCISALGEAPQSKEETDGQYVQTVNSLKPYRVAEPLYWLMAKNNCIPYRLYEKYRKKNETKIVNIYYYDSERGGIMQQRHQEALKANRIKTDGLFGKWELVEKSN